MELIDLMKSQNACRYYTADPLPEQVLARVLDAARWAPQGGNRQPVRLVVVRDPAHKRLMQEWYLEPWEAYLAAARQGGLRISAEGGQDVPRLLRDADHFARHLDQIPVWVVVCALLADIHATDLEQGRPPVVYGASIFPAVQNMLLKARAEGLGSTLTTLLCHAEPRVKQLLGIPAEVATCAMVTLGWPARPFPRQLSRRPLEQIAFDGRYGVPLQSSETP